MAWAASVWSTQLIKEGRGSTVEDRAGSTKQTRSDRENKEGSRQQNSRFIDS